MDNVICILSVEDVGSLAHSIGETIAQLKDQASYADLDNDAETINDCVKKMEALLNVSAKIKDAYNAAKQIIDEQNPYGS
jgi:hypothetical protein